ncbi:MAG: amidohydrolase family protein, partial [Deltaproteobacteria bacterium]|nr:amidohydrolase family protein [Deltaproteobacteria bacterium]
MSLKVIKGRVIDGTGSDPIEHGIVVVEDKKIAAVCREDAYELPEAAEVFEVDNATIMPGFIDLHIHYGLGTTNLVDVYLRNDIEKAMMAVFEMGKTIEAGFTSVREAGGLANFFKGPIAEGFVQGPRICAAGQYLTQTGGHADLIQKLPVSFTRERVTHTCIADGVPACREAARLQFRNGADFLKIMTTGGVTSQGDGNRESQFSLSEIRAFVEEAEMHDTYVATHAHGTQGIKNALLGGVKSIEHGMFYDDECIELMIRNNAYLVPTFTIVNTYMENLDKLPPWVVDKITASHEAHFVSARRCYEAGVKIGLGSDLIGDPKVCPFGINGREFELLTKIGMSPMEAIVAGTRTASELMRMPDKIGTLGPGKLADITVCTGNPLDDISIL